MNEHQKDLPSELSKDQIKMILMEDSQDLAETDDMVEPILSQNNESNDVKTPMKANNLILTRLTLVTILDCSRDY